MARLTLQDITAGFNLVTTINANNALIEAFAELSYQRDGEATNTLTADMDVNSKKLTNLAAGTNNSDAITLKQLNDASVVALTAAASAVTLADAGAKYVATTAEAAFAELAGVAAGEGANIIGLEDSADNFVAVTAEAALAEFFTGTKAQIITIGGFRAEEAAGVDYIEMTHDGTDAAITGFQSTDLNVTGFTSIKADATILLQESATAPADAAGYGQIWVKTATPNLLYFVDDTGQEYLLGGQNQPDGTTTAALEGVGNLVNTWDRKLEGFQLFNKSTNKPVWAAGSAAADVWVGADGATLHSPV